LITKIEVSSGEAHDGTFFPVVQDPHAEGVTADKAYGNAALASSTSSRMGRITTAWAAPATQGAGSGFPYRAGPQPQADVNPDLGQGALGDGVNWLEGCARMGEKAGSHENSIQKDPPEFHFRADLVHDVRNQAVKRLLCNGLIMI